MDRPGGRRDARCEARGKLLKASLRLSTQYQGTGGRPFDQRARPSHAGQRERRISMTLRMSVRRAGGMALAASVALLTYMATPAFAHGSGQTTGGHSNVTGNAVPDPTQPLCLLAPRTTITLYNTGTFNDTSGITHTARFTATEDYYFGPGGTYSDSTCTTRTAVDGTLDTTGGANCEETTATYQRVDSTYTITTTASTTCDLAGGGNDNHTTNNLTYTGTQLACTPEGVACANGA